MNASSSQPILCSLLRYFHHGSLASMRKAFELCIPNAEAQEPYFYFNLLTALNISGLVEITETDQKKEWCVAFDSDVITHGYKPKKIPTTKSGFEQFRDELHVMISTTTGSPLLTGCALREQKDSELRNFFGKSFVDRLPRFKDIESQICHEEVFQLENATSIQRYDQTGFTWNEIAETPHDPCLVRVRHKFGGLRFYVLLPKHRLQFRLFYHDWSSFAAFNILGWDQHLPFSISRDALSIQRGFRIPTILLRFLFASSDSVSIGSRLEFRGTADFALETFSNFFTLGCNQ